MKKLILGDRDTYVWSDLDNVGRVWFFDEQGHHFAQVAHNFKMIERPSALEEMLEVSGGEKKDILAAYADEQKDLKTKTAPICYTSAPNSRSSKFEVVEYAQSIPTYDPSLQNYNNGLRFTAVPRSISSRLYVKDSERNKLKSLCEKKSKDVVFANAMNKDEFNAEVVKKILSDLRNAANSLRTAGNDGIADLKQFAPSDSYGRIFSDKINPEKLSIQAYEILNACDNLIETGIVSKTIPNKWANEIRNGLAAISRGWRSNSRSIPSSERSPSSRAKSNQ